MNTIASMEKKRLMKDINLHKIITVTMGSGSPGCWRGCYIKLTKDTSCSRQQIADDGQLTEKRPRLTASMTRKHNCFW